MLKIGNKVRIKQNLGKILEGTKGKIDKIHEDNTFDITLETGEKINIQADLLEIDLENIAKTFLDLTLNTIKRTPEILKLDLDKIEVDYSNEDVKKVEEFVKNLLEQKEIEDVSEIIESYYGEISNFVLNEIFKPKLIKKSESLKYREIVEFLLKDLAEQIRYQPEEISKIYNLPLDKVLKLKEKFNYDNEDIENLTSMIIQLDKEKNFKTVEELLIAPELDSILETFLEFKLGKLEKEAINPVMELKNILRKIHPDLSDEELDKMIEQIVSKASSEYNEFVKKYFEEHPDAKPGDPKVMEEISRLWEEEKKKRSFVLIQQNLEEGVSFKKAQEIAKNLKNLKDKRRWAYGTKTSLWYLIDFNDRDFESGLTHEELLNLTEEGAKEKYLRFTTF